MKSKKLLLKKEKISNLAPQSSKGENCSFDTTGTIPPPTTLPTIDGPKPPETFTFPETIVFI